MKIYIISTIEAEYLYLVGRFFKNIHFLVKLLTYRSFGSQLMLITLLCICIANTQSCLAWIWEDEYVEWTDTKDIEEKTDQEEEQEKEKDKTNNSSYLTEEELQFCLTNNELQVFDTSILDCSLDVPTPPPEAMTYLF